MESSSFRNENEFITALQKSDEAAISEIFNDTYKELVDFAYQMVKDWDDAENLAIQSFLHLLEKRGALKDRTRIRSFLYVATRNGCYTHLRKVRSAARFQQEVEYLENQKYDSQPEYDFARMDVEIISALYAEIDKLPTKCKAIFTMRYVKNVPTDQIAEELGLERKTVQNQILKASNHIRSAFSAKKLYPASIPLFLISFLF